MTPSTPLVGSPEREDGAIPASQDRSAALRAELPAASQAKPAAAIAEGPPKLDPIMLCGLTWKQARAALGAVDCAVRRAHWCSPVVILQGDKLVLDDDGELSPFQFMRGDRSGADWSMVPRVDDDGNKVPPTYRETHLGKGNSI